MLKAFGKDIALYGLVDFLFRSVSFAVFPLYAHALHVDEFGVLALIGTAATLVGLFANCGTNNAVQRFYWEPGNDRAEQREIVSTGLALLVGVTLGAVAAGLAVIAPLSGRVEDRYGVSLALAAVALLAVIPEQLLQYSLDTVRLHFAPWRFVFISSMKNLLGTALSLGLVLGLGLGVLGFYLGGLLAGMAALPFAFAMIRRDLGGTISGARARELFRFGHPFVFAGLGYWLLTSLDRWMLAEMSDATEVGLYSIAAKFATAVFFLNTAFGQAWSPFAMKIRRERADYRQVYATIGAGWFFVLAWVACALALFSRELLDLLTPTEYHAAALPMALLAMGSVLFGTTQITAIGISISARTHLFMRATWGVAGLNFALNLVLIPFAGATGAAIATMASYGALTGLYVYWSQSLHPLPLQHSKFAYSALCCCAALLMAVLPPALPLSAAKVLFLAVMPWLAFRLRVVQFSDLKMPAGAGS